MMCRFRERFSPKVEGIGEGFTEGLNSYGIHNFLTNSTPFLPLYTFFKESRERKKIESEREKFTWGGVFGCFSSNHLRSALISLSSVSLRGFSLPKAWAKASMMRPCECRREHPFALFLPGRPLLCRAAGGGGK
jgi:hypothetical protein